MDDDRVEREVELRCRGANVGAWESVEVVCVAVGVGHGSPANGGWELLRGGRFASVEASPDGSEALGGAVTPEASTQVSASIAVCIDPSVGDNGGVLGTAVLPSSEELLLPILVAAVLAEGS